MLLCSIGFNRVRVLIECGVLLCSMGFNRVRVLTERAASFDGV